MATTTARPALSRDRILRAAITLADRGGIDAVTMRKVAETLGVEAMSLYHHVGNKGDLLDGMVDLVFGEVELPSPEVSDWRRSMRDRAISAREVLARHPWATPLMDSRSNPGPGTLRHHDRVLGALRQAGFSVELAAHAFSLIDSYVYGFAIQEAALPFDGPGEVGELADSIVEHLPVAEYPYFLELVREHALRPDYDHGAEFAWGLDLVLDGLDRRLRP